jgi:leucyl-tRNA synthetase
MRSQLEHLGFSYDWRRQMFAHRPEYYKWDQWFFLKMYEMGLAYKRTTQVNWCEHDQATLSNEQASGGLCWRCGNPVTKKKLEQWFLRTTAYADQLLDDMADIEHGWPQNVVKRQRDWIGRSAGAYVDFTVTEPVKRNIRVFTTRIDTIYGANSVVVAAEHPIVQDNRDAFSPNVIAKIDEIIAENLKPRERDEEIEKDGIDTGLGELAKLFRPAGLTEPWLEGYLTGVCTAPVFVSPPDWLGPLLHLAAEDLASEAKLQRFVELSMLRYNDAVEAERAR